MHGLPPDAQVCACGTHEAVLLQSLTKGPTPRMPLAPKDGTVFSVTSIEPGSGTQVGFALEGSPAEVAPITCTMTLVAAISEALLFKHFPSKAALYAEILAEECEADPELAHLRGQDHPLGFFDSLILYRPHFPGD